MFRITDAAELAECIAPLDDEGRRALRRYWEQVIQEEWVPPARRAPRPVPLSGLDERRARREARRAIARIARAGRAARVPVLAVPNVAEVRGAGEAA
jgi:hypothetical protein